MEMNFIPFCHVWIYIGNRFGRFVRLALLFRMHVIEAGMYMGLLYIRPVADILYTWIY